MQTVAGACETQLARFIGDTTLSCCDSQVRLYAQRLMMDVWWCCVGALGTVPGRKVLSVGMESPRGAASVLGLAHKVDWVSAVYCNARLGNLLDCDETFMMQSHHAQSAFASALACCEHTGKGPSELLLGFIVGYEVGARVARFLGAGLELDETGRARRWTGLVGPVACVYAAAAAAARLLGLREREIVECLRLVPSYSPTRVAGWSHRPELGTVKYIDTGWAAQSGLMAARMAACGITGIQGTFDDVLSANTTGVETRQDNLLGGLGSQWWLVMTSFKRWPCCRWMHYPLTAFSILLDHHDVSPADILRIELSGFPQATRAPCFACADVRHEVAAMYNYPHACAMMLARIPAGPQWFTPAALASSQSTSIRRRVYVSTNVSSLDPASWRLQSKEVRIPSAARIVCSNRVLEKSVDFAIGDPWEPKAAFSQASLEQKAHDMISGHPKLLRTNADYCETVAKVFLALPEIYDLRDITRLLAPLSLP